MPPGRQQNFRQQTPPWLSDFHPKNARTQKPALIGAVCAGAGTRHISEQVLFRASLPPPASMQEALRILLRILCSRFAVFSCATPVNMLGRKSTPRTPQIVWGVAYFLRHFYFMSRIRTSIPFSSFNSAVSRLVLVSLIRTGFLMNGTYEIC